MVLSWVAIFFYVRENTLTDLLTNLTFVQAFIISNNWIFKYFYILKKNLLFVLNITKITIDSCLNSKSDGLPIETTNHTHAKV